MHFSRMCTVRCSVRLGGAGLSAQEGGGSAQGMGVSAWGVSARHLPAPVNKMTDRCNK